MISNGLGMAAAAVVLGRSAAPVRASDYESPKAALDALDGLAAICGMRLGQLRAERPDARVLVARFLASLHAHRMTREDVRRRFQLPPGIDPASLVGEADGDLGGLRQSLDDLMVAYAESLPVFGDASVVARLAVDMVDISRCRTVIDLWAESEAA